jgi:uncharacterized protein YkwD
MEKLLVLLALLVSGLGYSQENPATVIGDSSTSIKLTISDLKNINLWVNTPLDTDSLSKEIVKTFNNYREFMGLTLLVENETLSKSADIQAKYCSSIGMSTHNQPNEKLGTAQKRLMFVDSNEGKNFYVEISLQTTFISSYSRNRTLSEDILDAFYSSTSHRVALDSDIPKKIGVSVYRDSYDGLYVVAVLGE